MVAPGWRREVNDLASREETLHESTSNAESPSSGESLGDRDLLGEGARVQSIGLTKPREGGLTIPAFSGAQSAP